MPLLAPCNCAPTEGLRGSVNDEMQHVLQRQSAHLHANVHEPRAEEAEEEGDERGNEEGADEGAGLGFEAGAVVEGLAAVSSQEQMDEMIGDATMRDHRMSMQDQTGDLGIDLGIVTTVNATLRDSFDSALMSADGMSVSFMSTNGPWCCT